MAGPLIRPPTKRQVIVGSIAFAVAVGIMALAGSTGRLASEVQKEREAQILAQLSASPQPTTAAADCLGVIEQLTGALIATQDALREAAQGGDYSRTDLQASAETATEVEGGKDITACEDADPDTADTVHAAMDAVQDAAKTELTEEKAQGFLEAVEQALALAE